MVKSKLDLKAMYNDQAYVEMYEKKPLSRLKNLVKHMRLTKQQNVVDFACGNGLLLEVISNSVSSYVGVDYSNSLINAAIKRKERLQVTNAKFVCSEINIFSDANQNVFDVAFAMDFSEHVLDEDWKTILLCIKKSLKKNGLFYVHTPNGEFFLEKMKRHGIVIAQLPGHIAVRTLSENKRLLQESGFTINRIELIPHYNILRFIHFLSFVPYIGRYFKARIFLEAKNGSS